jgi:hypothetical protein
MASTQSTLAAGLYGERSELSPEDSASYYTPPYGDERILMPFFDGNSGFLGWRCSKCSWTMSNPADCTLESFHLLLEEFDLRDCNAFSIAPNLRRE